MPTETAAVPRPAQTSLKLRMWARVQSALGPALLHRHQTPEELVGTDIDCALSIGHSPASVAEQLHAAGLKIVQYYRYESNGHDLVLAEQAADGGWAFLRLDLATDLRLSTDRRLSGRVFLTEGDLSPSSAAGDAVSVAPDVAFADDLIKRVVKTSLQRRHGERLSRLYREDPPGCQRMIERFWGPESARRLVTAAAQDDWGAIARSLRPLRSELLRRSGSRRPVAVAAYWFADVVRLAGRWLRPNGLHVVLLGADGSGKSSVIRRLAEDVDGPFSSASVRHLAPMSLPHGRASRATTDPHGRPARRLLPSLAKALYWLFDYSVGYHLRVRPALVRSTLVLYDRYLVDVLVDPRRYRYGGPAWLTRLVWRLVPKPDLVVVLDAPPVVLRARKQEVTPAETARQRAAYRELGRRVRGGRIVDAAQPLDAVVADVRTAIVEFLADRAARRLRLPVRR